MREPTPQTIYLKSYTPPAYSVSRVELDFDIRDDHTLVRAHLRMHRTAKGGALELDGDEIELVSIAIDGVALTSEQYTLSATRLTVAKTPTEFVLETLTRIKPHANTKLMGLYASKDGLFTQCEAEGFRRITWFPDRPDVMARYTTTIHADRARYPVLLSNGNPVDAGTEPGGRHWAKWVDPFPKPSYLFAMVAGKLDRLADTFVTQSRRTVKLEIYVEPGKLDQCGFAMQALKKSMKWDEDVFGLELDLDQYMIVAVGDFNMGAMENKGLNVFNTKYVLARADVATDRDFQNIDRVVAHEYFHNWTGNRVTCRDWFQLSLKEGLTVFRDQEFGADMYSRAVQRIQEVRGLRAGQFPEDAGPMAHPVRPSSYMEISNFYTATVYEKGAEVVRMINTLIGAANFRKGMDLYFKRHDGQAVTTEDFAQAMQDASGIDLMQFRRWYEQAGTPVLEAASEYDASLRRFTLTVKQSTPPTPGQSRKLPLHIPFEIGLVGADGHDIPLRRAGDAKAGSTTRIVSLHEPIEQITFVDVPPGVVPSLLRGFTAPVILRYDYTDAELTHLMAYDSDPVNRWEAGQRLATGLLLRNVSAIAAGRAPERPIAFIEAFRRVLTDAGRDPEFAAEVMSLPAESYLAEQMSVVDPDAIHTARNHLRRAIGNALRSELLATYRAMTLSGPYQPDAVSIGRRALRNTCLGYLMEAGDREALQLCLEQFDTADNMTDGFAALTMLANRDTEERQPALDRFYKRWMPESLVIDKWFMVQATAQLASTLKEVTTLLAHPAFDIRNPNKVYALIRGFCANHVCFHVADGAGYRFAADRIIQIDAMNPQVASRIARAFDRWRKFDPIRQHHAQAALERIRAAKGLSKDVTEIVARALA